MLLSYDDTPSHREEFSGWNIRPIAVRSQMESRSSFSKGLVRKEILVSNFKPSSS